MEIPGIKTRLFYYQEEILRALEGMRRGICAADTGLGKTLIALSYTSRLLSGFIEQAEQPIYGERKALILCEPTLLEVWRREMNRHFHSGTFRPIVVNQAEREHINGADRGACFARLVRLGYTQGGCNVVIAPYSWLDAVNRDACKAIARAENGGRLPSARGKRKNGGTNNRRLVNMPLEERRRLLDTGRGAFSLFTTQFSVLICDEAQKINNRATLRSIATSAIRAHDIFYFSASPQENNAEELRSLFVTLRLAELRHADPEVVTFVGSKERWANAVRDKYHGARSGDSRLLNLLLERHMFRVNKKDVLLRSVCTLPGSRHLRAIEAGQHVPPTELLLEDLVTVKKTVPFCTAAEVRANNMLLERTQQHLRSIEERGRGGRAEGKMAPLAALIILRKMCFSMRTFCPRALLAGELLGKAGGAYRILREEWGQGKEEGTRSCTLHYETKSSKKPLTYVVDPVLLPDDLLEEARRVPSTKTRLVGDYVVDQVWSHRNKSVIFLHWRVEMIILREYLDTHLWPGCCLLIHGGVPEANRATLVDSLRNSRMVGGDPAVLLAMEGTFSTGIDLSFMCRSLSPDIGYNPFHRIQGEARTWRFGQKKLVESLLFLIKGTVDEQLFIMNSRKYYETTMMLDGHDALVRDSAAEGSCLQEIFAMIRSACPILEVETDFAPTTEEVHRPSPPPRPEIADEGGWIPVSGRKRRAAASARKQRKIQRVERGAWESVDAGTSIWADIASFRDNIRSPHAGRADVLMRALLSP